MQAGDKRIRLMGRDSKATQAGLVYYEQILGVRAPTLYDCNQELEADKFVQVRRRGLNDEWVILKQGEDYFRYHRTTWTPRIPRLIIKRNTKDPNASDIHWVARKTLGSSDYVGLPDFDEMTAGTVRLAAQNGRPIFASEDVQREEVIQAALAHIKKLPTMTLRDG